MILLCLLVAGCQPPPRPATTPTAAAILPAPVSTTLSPLPSPTQPPSQATAQPQAAARTHYRIDATLEDTLRDLRVRVEIRFTNPTGQALETIPLLVEANRYEGAFELLNAAAAGGGAVLVEELQLNRLTLRLQPALAAGETLTLGLEYRLHLPQIAPDRLHVFGYTQKQINLTDWYPCLPPFDAGQGWLLHPPAETGEHTVYPAADFDVELRLPTQNPALVVAAAAPAVATAGGYRYHLEAARNFVWLASPEYLVNTRQEGAVAISSYSYPATELAARAALDYTARAIRYFTEQFGPLPRSSLSIVQADFPDGMEFDGLFFLSERFYYGFDGSPRSYLALISVHESAHQWWYAQVGNDQALEPWLDEALCTYSELLFYENLNPELAAWWWKFRVEPYRPSGSLSQSIYDFSAFLPYRNTIYLRGAQFFHAVRQEIGDAAFFEALRVYARQQSGRIAGRRDLLEQFEQSTPGDLTALEAEFFEP